MVANVKIWWEDGDEKQAHCGCSKRFYAVGVD